MKQTRKIVTAKDILKIINDEKEYIEANFGKRLIDNDLLTNESLTGNHGQVTEVKGIGYYFNELNYSFDAYHDIGTLTEFEASPLDPGYDCEAAGKTMPWYGAIIPEKDYPVVEEISKMHYVVPVHVQFFGEENENHPVKVEIILLYANSLKDAKQVAELCNCDFSDWVMYGNPGFEVLDPSTDTE